jgi:hypothetical protein
VSGAGVDRLRGKVEGGQGFGGGVEKNEERGRMIV